MAVHDPGNPPLLDAGAKQTNPTTSTVMAQTEALAAGNYEVRATIGASAAAIFQLERRNAADAASVDDVTILYVAAGQSAEFLYLYEIDALETMRIMMNANLTGTAAASLHLEKLG